MSFLDTVKEKFTEVESWIHTGVITIKAYALEAKPILAAVQTDIQQAQPVVQKVMAGIAAVWPGLEGAVTLEDIGAYVTAKVVALAIAADDAILANGTSLALDGAVLQAAKQVSLPAAKAALDAGAPPAIAAQIHPAAVAPA